MADLDPRRIASGLLAATGVLHLVLVPEYLEEEPYVGVLFLLGGLVAVALAARLWRADDRLAAAGGAVVAGGMAAGFLLSRTVGLPDFHPGDWELSGVVSLLLELGYLAVFARFGRGERAIAPSSA